MNDMSNWRADIEKAGAMETRRESCAHATGSRSLCTRRRRGARPTVHVMLEQHLKGQVHLIQGLGHLVLPFLYCNFRGMYGALCNCMLASLWYMQNCVHGTVRVPLHHAYVVYLKNSNKSFLVCMCGSRCEMAGNSACRSMYRYIWCELVKTWDKRLRCVTGGWPLHELSFTQSIVLIQCIHEYVPAKTWYFCWSCPESRPVTLKCDVSLFRSRLLVALVSLIMRIWHISSLPFLGYSNFATWLWQIESSTCYIVIFTCTFRLYMGGAQ